MENNLLRPETLEKIKKIRRVFLWAAVWIMIVEFVVGAILILAKSQDLSIARIQGSFLLLAAALLISVNNFVRIEKGDKTIQALAIAGLVANVVCVVLGILLIWGIIPAFWTEETRQLNSYTNKYYTAYTPRMTLWMRFLIASIAISAIGFLVPNVMVIKETIKVVKPLKITAIVCVLYCSAFGILVALTDPDYEDVERLYELFGLAIIGFNVTSLAAFVISRVNRKIAVQNTPMVMPNAVKTEEELRREIEEKVRREMMERDVREKIESEKIIEETFESKE